MKRISILAAALFAGQTWATDLLSIYRDAQVSDATYAGAKAQYIGAQEKLPQARALLLPNVNFGAGTHYNSTDSNYPSNVYPWLHLKNRAGIEVRGFGTALLAPIVIGLGYGIFGRGHNMMGIDFAGGDSVAMNFSQRVDQKDISKAIAKIPEVKDPVIQYQKDVVSGKEILRITSPSGTATRPSLGRSRSTRSRRSQSTSGRSTSPLARVVRT